MHLRLLLPLPLLLLACACQQTSQATFTVEVANISSTPLSVGFTKNGPPVEEGWTSPQDIPHTFAARHWGTLIRPGETRVLGPITGHFAERVIGLLRVYAGDATVEDLLAYGRDDPDRLDIPLPEGKSSFIINNPGGGRLIATTPEGHPAGLPKP